MSHFRGKKERTKHEENNNSHSSGQSLVYHRSIRLCPNRSGKMQQRAIYPHRSAMSPRNDALHINLGQFCSS